MHHGIFGPARQRHFGPDFLHPGFKNREAACAFWQCRRQEQRMMVAQPFGVVITQPAIRRDSAAIKQIPRFGFSCIQHQHHMRASRPQQGKRCGQFAPQDHLCHAILIRRAVQEIGDIVGRGQAPKRPMLQKVTVLGG